jgi:hypothetical protein
MSMLQTQITGGRNIYGGKMINLKNVTLEMSLKPFKQTDDPAITRVIEKVFDQWYALTKHADMVSILLWTADGSEILDYAGNFDDEIEWARYVGGAVRKIKLNPNDPEQIGLHSRPYLYMANPPVITYGLLRTIVHKIKEIGTQKLSKPIRVGATFDPGPEFARSSFKYNRHPEISCGNTMGERSFVCAHTTLNADDRAYAGFPDGIPQDTPFGRFFGRQCQHFLSDLGFDYVWFSNGFGFGTETWGIRGAIFTGEKFQVENITAVQEGVLSFWHFFREECPHFPIETRGTNLSTGIDLAGDGVPLKEIYNGGFHLLPPPNSPWAAINGDFGIELAGQMSRICELPGDDYPFRYYIHDPWWMNSPWLDRYGREPHDIYLPLALTRLDDKGQAHPPNHVQFLTIDNSLGGIPDQVPNEVIPHILAGFALAPDAPSPFVWIYPFDEYHEMVHMPERIGEVFFGDWFIRGAIAQGFPLNTVVSTANFCTLMQMQPRFFDKHVLVSPVPAAGSGVEQAMFEFAVSGGQVLLYGPLTYAGEVLRKTLNVKIEEPLSGELKLDLLVSHPDTLRHDAFPERIIHRPLINAGGIREAVQNESDETTVCATVSDGTETRVAALISHSRSWDGGQIGWVRGTISSRIEPEESLLVSDDLKALFSGESIMRVMLSHFGYEICVTKQYPNTKTPITLVHRRANGFYFSGFTPDTTASLSLRFPQGAPLLLGGETVLESGYSTYHLPRAWNRECRVFVAQENSSVVSCVELPVVSYLGKRKIGVYGLKDATVRFYPEAGSEETTTVLLNAKEPYLVGESVKSSLKRDGSGSYLEVYAVNGWLVFSWDLPDKTSEQIHQLTALYD